MGLRGLAHFSRHVNLIPFLWICKSSWQQKADHRCRLRLLIPTYPSSLASGYHDGDFSPKNCSATSQSFPSTDFYPCPPASSAAFCDPKVKSTSALQEVSTSFRAPLPSPVFPSLSVRPAGCDLGYLVIEGHLGPHSTFFPGSTTWAMVVLTFVFEGGLKPINIPIPFFSASTTISLPKPSCCRPCNSFHRAFVITFFTFLLLFYPLSPCSPLCGRTGNTSQEVLSS